MIKTKAAGTASAPASTSFLERSEGAPGWLIGGAFGTEASVPADILLGISARLVF